MIFLESMTSDKNYSAGGGSFNYYTVGQCYDLENPKRMSPSSWDESDEEELTDTNSTLYNSDHKQTRFYDASATSEALEGEEDRRQSSARVRRRKKDSTKSPLGLSETDVGSSSDSSFIAWDDRDTDGIIFDIELYLNERNFSQTFPKRPGFILHESESPVSKSHRPTKICEENKKFRSLSVNLSRIVEVDESRSNASLGTVDNSPMVKATIDSSEGPKSDTGVTCVKEFETPGEEIVPSCERNSKNVLSPEDDEEIFTKEKKPAQNRIAPTMGKNLDDMYYKDTEYFDNTLVYFFEAEHSLGKVQKTRSYNYELDGLYFRKQVSRDYLESTAKIEENELSQSFREVNSVEERNYAEDKISIDKVEDVSSCTDTTHESGTPKRHGNLTGREKDHALSKESLGLGLENLFSLTRQTSSVPLTSNTDHDILQSANYDLIQKNECFLKDVSPSHTDTDTFSRLFTHFHDSGPKSPLFSRIINPKGMTAQPDISSGEYVENEDLKGEGLFKILRKHPSYNNSLFGNESKVNQINEGSIQSHKKSKSSFKSNASFELDSSDKSSTTEMKIYGDSFSEMASSVTSGSAENNGKSPSIIIHKLSKTGKPPATRSNRTDDASISNQNQNPLSKQDKFGCADFGATEWSAVRNTGESTDYPQDRGDMKFESYNFKSDWGRLIDELDERCRINRPVNSIFRVEVQENLRSNKSEYHQDKNVKPVKSFERFSKTCARGRVGTWNITKAKKRKRETNFADVYVTSVTPNFSNSSNEIIKKNWLVNAITTKRRVRHGKGSLKSFLVMRGKGQKQNKIRYGHQHQSSHFADSTTGDTDCFRTLFKQLVNFFTVFWPKNRN